MGHYQTWNTRAVKKNVNPITNWVVMCGTNDPEIALPGNIVLNGENVGTRTGGDGSLKLHVNLSGQTSDFAIAEVVVWDRGLTSAEMHEATDYLVKKMGLVIKVIDVVPY